MRSLPWWLSHVCVFFGAMLAGVAHQRWQSPAYAPAVYTASDFLQSCLEKPQQLLLLTSRLQIDRFPRGADDSPRRTLGGNVDVAELLQVSPTYARLWARRGESAVGDAPLVDALSVADEHVVWLLTHAAVDEDAATAALGAAAWLGLPKTCAALLKLGADVGLGSNASGLGRNALHVAAARGHDAAYFAIDRCASKRHKSQRDAFGESPKAMMARRAALRGAARRRSDDCDFDSVDVSTMPLDAFERAVHSGLPLLVRGLARDWPDRAAWAPLKLALDFPDFEARPHPIPHGESFGIPPPRGTLKLRDFIERFPRNSTVDCAAQCGPDDVSKLPDYIFDAGLLATKLFAAHGALVAEMDRAVEPSPRIDALLNGFPSKLHRLGHGASRQVFVGPAGAGAPFHYHEHAINALLHGEKRWFLLEPARAVYSTAHPLAWAAAPPQALQCTQRAGDVLFVPALWSHAVENVNASVGAAFEFVDTFFVHWSNTRIVPLLNEQRP
ncbi:hypothetical protein M885DRAFT_587099 [Pelagophyceae sp. CCMP2097]|nr:hypothetical protein M885DRAFT_587099 [Pelagophyceae sp. CCMP2097]